MTAHSDGRGPNRVCTLAWIQIPIIQAPMTYIAGAQLADAADRAARNAGHRPDSRHGTDAGDDLRRASRVEVRYDNSFQEVKEVIEFLKASTQQPGTCPGTLAGALAALRGPHTSG